MPTISRKAFWSLFLLLMFGLSAHVYAQAGREPIKRSLALFGDLQIGYSAWQQTKLQNPSSTNIPQLSQTLLDLKRFPKADLGLLMGDLVMAEADDQGQTLQIQLDAWQALYQGFSRPKNFSLLPVVGNHEINIYRVSLGAQFPSADMYAVWLNWMAAHAYDRRAGNGPKPDALNLDQLVLDESSMTYSFNLKDVHILLINTDTLSTQNDPATGQPYAGWIPIHWIARDLARAQENPRVKAILVAGHRPLEAPSYDQSAASTTILNSAAHPFASALSNLLKQHRKVRAYLTAHTHSWEAFRLEQGAGVMQIIAGNGGAELDAGWQPDAEPYFGFSILDIYASGRLALRNYGRALPPAPQKFYEGTPVAPQAATLRSRVRIPRR